jgi:hypothetical protein
LPGVSRASAVFRTALKHDAIEQLAREHGFVQRQRLVTGSSVFWALMLSLGAHPLDYISDVLRTLNQRESWSLRYKPFWNRLAKPQFADFMKALFVKLARELPIRVLEKVPGGELARFSEILLDDGSSFAVANGLRTVFPGRFTNITPAAVELHAQMSLLNDSLNVVTLAPDKEAERQFLPEPEALPPRSLSLRDRGYIDRAYFERLQAVEESKRAFLICRTPKEINPTIVAVRGMPRRLGRKWEGKSLRSLQKKRLKQNLDLDVQWPRPRKTTLRLRLVVRYVPEKKSWTWFLTNVPTEVSADVVAQLYRLRWQIELVFKDWKSNSNLHALQSENAAIVEGFIWASLCAALIKRALAHWTQFLAEKPISTRIAAMAGPQIMPMLAAWARSPRSVDRLVSVFGFLAGNALRTNPRRDRAGPRGTLGLRFVGAPESGADLPRGAPGARRRAA